MKKIITAIGNSLINDNLKNNNKYLVQTPDIQFEEDLIEVLKNKKDTEVLILNIELIKKETINNYINKIKEINKKIKIILLSEKENENIKNIIIANGIKDIFYGNEISILKLEEAIDRTKTTEEILTEEINNLKEIILNENKNKENYFRNFKLLKQKNIFNKNKNVTIKNEKEKNNRNKIISITGGSGVGKSIFCSNISLAFENEKTLIIDFDILNKSIKTIFGVKEKVAEEKEIWNENKLDNLIINLSPNLDLICGIDVIFENGYKVEKEKLITILNELKSKYEIILLDTSSECFMDYTKEIINYSDFSIFLVEANLIELKKAKKLLDIYINKWKINKEKINIVFNKYNKNSIDNNILKKLFFDFTILGYLKLNENYNYLINKNYNFINKELKEEYKKIIEKIK